MRRALDNARAELRTRKDRDAILDVFFDYARRMFKFSVLFIVRDNVAHGRNVDGLGAPPGLVSRLSIPLSQPGILAQAREVRKPFIASVSATGADAHLLGTLGRAMPVAVVAPVVVRDRLVAILL